MSESLNKFLQQNFYGNTLEDFLWFFGILLAGFIFKKLLSTILSQVIFRIFKKFSGTASAKELNELLKKPFGLLLFLILGYIAAVQLNFPDHWETKPGDTFSIEIIVHIVYKVLVVIALTWICMRVVDFLALIMASRASQTESKLDDQLVPFFRDSLKILIVIFSMFFILASVFHVNVVTLIGGLGIGGLAVALAAKETLENLLGSFTIFLDKPFTIGDHVKVGDVGGHVEKIGLRSTRIRTLEKSIVTVPNKKMVDAELENVTERSLWRVKFYIGVLYSTTTGDLTKIIGQIKSFLDNHEMIEPDPAVKFEQFGASSLDIVIVFIVRTGEFGVMMNVREEVNFEVMKIVRSNNTDFAFPSTSLYIEHIPEK